MQKTGTPKQGSGIMIYTDGSSLGNPGPGGYGCVIVFRDHGIVTELGGYNKTTTNNKMELMAILSALEHVKHKKIDSKTLITIYTDSSYAINGITKWVFGWQKNNWKTSTKTDVQNVDLWKPLALITHYFTKLSFVHVRGHTGIWGNERCDLIATSFAKGEKPRLFYGNIAQYDERILLPKVSGTSGASGMVSQKKKSSSGKAFSYVAQVAGKVHTFSDWESCKSAVYGRSAKYKKVFSKQEEQQLIDEWK